MKREDFSEEQNAKLDKLDDLQKAISELGLSDKTYYFLSMAFDLATAEVVGPVSTEVGTEAFNKFLDGMDTALQFMRLSQKLTAEAAVKAVAQADGDSNG